MSAEKRVEDLIDRLVKIRDEPRIAESLHGFGGFLRCEQCGHRSGVDLADEDATRYLANGWPRHCGYTMRWWTARQIAAGEVPEFGRGEST